MAVEKREPKYSFIALKHEVYDELTGIGRKGESYSDLVKRVIKGFRENEKRGGMV